MIVIETNFVIGAVSIIGLLVMVAVIWWRA